MRLAETYRGARRNTARVLAKASNGVLSFRDVWAEMQADNSQSWKPTPAVKRRPVQPVGVKYPFSSARQNGRHAGVTEGRANG